MHKTYDSEPERALRKALRAHWRDKYGTMERAAGFLGCTPALLSAIGRGLSWPKPHILKDAGIEVTVTRTVTWERCDAPS